MIDGDCGVLGVGGIEGGELSGVIGRSSCDVMVD